MKGIYSALLVSFDKEGNINEKGLRQIVRHNIDVNKVDGLYVGGSTGENFMLSTDEKKRIFEIAKDEAKDEIKLIAQEGSVNIKEAVELAKFATDLGYDALSAVTPFYYKFDFAEIKHYYLIAQEGSVNIKEAVELAKFATDLGYDALSAVTPFYYKFDFAEIKHYYETIINSVDNKMIIYSIPFLTGVNMSLDQFAELFENDLLESMRKAFANKLIFAGFVEMMLPATVLGVDGAIGSTFNVNGRRAKKIFDLARNNQIQEALEVQHVTNDLITDILGNGLYQTIKLILEEQGVEAGYCRQPMKEATDEMRVKAKEMYQKYFVEAKELETV